VEEKQLSFYQIDYETQTNEFASTPHAHKHYEVFFFEKGNATHFVDFEQYPILDHSLFLVSKNQVHYITAKPHTYNYGFVLSISQELIELLDKDLLQLFGSLTQSPAYHIEASQFFSAIFKQMKVELTEERPMNVRIVFDLLKVLLTYLLRSVEIPSSKRSSYETSFLEFLSYLEDNFRTVRSVKAYAQLMNITPGQLNRICKANADQTALNLIHYRINLEAKRKIFFSSSQIKEICFQLGFEDAGHFHNFFKRMNGKSPVQFREEMLQIFN